MIKKRAIGFILKIYNRIMTTRVINRNNKVCRKIRSMLFHNICWECNASFGTVNKDKKIYIVRCPQDNMGLFAVINYVVWHFKRAEELGRIPVVDWQYYPNKYFTEDIYAGRKNIWNMFFEQPAHIELEDAYKSYDVVMSSGDWEPNALAEVDDENMLAQSSEVYHRYIRLNEEMKTLLQAEKERVGIDRYSVLGVKIRGTDFITANPADHSKVGGTQETVEVINEKDAEWGHFDRIYLATEDLHILEQMKSVYGDKLFYTESHSFNSDDVGKRWLGDVIDSADVSVDKIAEMKNYLITTYMLAETDSLIAPVVGGTLGAMRIKGKYNHLCLYRNDRYC